MNRRHFRESLAICRTDACGMYGYSASGGPGCLLLDGCPCKIDRHLMDGGGCLHPTEPQFPPTTEFAMSDQQNPPTKSVEEATTKKMAAPQSSRVTGVYSPMMGMGMGTGDPDVDGLPIIAGAFKAMTPEGQAASMTYLSAIAKTKNAHPA